VKVTLGKTVRWIRAFITVSAAVMSCNPISRINVFNRHAAVDGEPNIAVKFPPTVRVEIRPEKLALRGGVVWNDGLPPGVGIGR
jgi:hypothetical protein